ncbi:Gfo/Idh/MocA family protein [Kitasatospora sp. NPDC127111]|uniref:Gfo/Idh/MocA family protein n=1 Tax=Kitasatospora sp. NPDC127111 TaxID=3345363 RepID=UPI00362B5876
MSGLRVAVIGRTGGGNYGHQLDRAFAVDPRARIVAVADADEAAGRDKAAELGAPQHYTDHRRMLERERPDIVVVAPRHLDCHQELVLDSLAAGAHVYCEKPIAQSLAQADTMVEAAQRAGLRLGNALPFVHEPRFRQVRDLLESGRIGDVVQYRAVCKWDHRGGGQDFLILGVHFADMLRRLAGDPVNCFARVSAGGRPLSPEHVESGPEAAGLVAGDAIHASYEFGGRLIGTIESWRVGIEERPLQPYRLEIRGTEGILTIRAPYADHSLWYYPLPEVIPGGPAWERLETEEIPFYGRYHQLAAADFIDAVQEGRPPACSGEDGLAALEMIHAAYRSELAGGPVAFPLVNREHPLDKLFAAAH